MGSYLADGLKDLCDDKSKTLRRKKKATRHATQTRANQTSPSAQSSQQPKGLGAEPLPPAMGRTPARQTLPANPPSAQTNLDEKGKPEDMIADITSLFAELGNLDSSNDELKGEDLTESILHALNANDRDNEQPFDFCQDADESAVGRALATSVIKQILAKNILYEPMKQLSEKYSEWLMSEEIQGLEAGELERHKNLHGSILELIDVYETDPENLQKLMELFEKSKSFGTPPEKVYDALVDNPQAIEEDPEGLASCFQQ